MGKYQVIVEWIDSIDVAIEALDEWKGCLIVWWRHGGEQQPGDFDEAFRGLREAGLDGWADGNPAGGGVDALAAVVKGEELEEPGPMDEEALIAAIFGEAGEPDESKEAGNVTPDGVA